MCQSGWITSYGTRTFTQLVLSVVEIRLHQPHHVHVRMNTVARTRTSSTYLTCIASHAASLYGRWFRERWAGRFHFIGPTKKHVCMTHRLGAGMTHRPIGLARACTVHLRKRAVVLSRLFFLRLVTALANPFAETTGWLLSPESSHPVTLNNAAKNKASYYPPANKHVSRCDPWRIASGVRAFVRYRFRRDALFPGFPPRKVPDVFNIQLYSCN